jgi:NADP-dependent 3-hydroxy acid dehydrogenase YdfG
MGKTILITGASSGFGRLTAETLSNSEHKVFAGFRSTDGRKKQVADELRAKNIEILKLDVTDQDSVDGAIAQLLEKSNNGLDVVVNNAGMASAGISGRSRRSKLASCLKSMCSEFSASFERRCLYYERSVEAS